MADDQLFCGRCGTRNRAGARVCRHCGHRLADACPHCGQANRDQARFCRRCGAVLSPEPPAGGALLHGRYRIRRLLARGGMGAVYEAHDVRGPATVCAIKEIDLADVDAAEREAALVGFRREATLLRTLSHPNLVKVADNFATAGKEYLVMEYVQGATLDGFLHNLRRTEPLALRIGLQLCDVLDYLHGRTPPIIYRDLKPSNVMVEAATGLVKLIDFGIARFYKPGKQKDTKLLGTPGFAPPEQYGEGQTDARSDVFALGVTLHVLLTDYDVERTPWHYPPVTTLNPQVSTNLEQIIARATEMRVTRRYQSVDEMRDALRVCQASHTGARTEQPPVLKLQP